MMHVTMRQNDGLRADIARAARESCRSSHEFRRHNANDAANRTNSCPVETLPELRLSLPKAGKNTGKGFTEHHHEEQETTTKQRCHCGTTQHRDRTHTVHKAHKTTTRCVTTTCKIPNNDLHTKPSTTALNTTNAQTELIDTYNFTESGFGVFLLDPRAVGLRVEKECRQGTLGLVGILRKTSVRMSA